MRIISDSDAIPHADPDGGVLYLRPVPSQRQVLASGAMAYEEAVAELDKLKATGIDTDAVLSEAQKAPETVKKAAQAIRDALPSQKVRRYRFGALATGIDIGDTHISGHQPLMEAYDELDATSATWVDATVNDVWNAAIPSDADTRGPGADVPVSEGSDSAAE